MFIKLCKANQKIRKIERKKSHLPFQLMRLDNRPGLSRLSKNGEANHTASRTVGEPVMSGSQPGPAISSIGRIEPSGKQLLPHAPQRTQAAYSKCLYFFPRTWPRLWTEPSGKRISAPSPCAFPISISQGWRGHLVGEIRFASN